MVDFAAQAAALESDLTRVLEALRGAGPSNPRGVAEMCDTTRFPAPTMTRHVARLTARGLVTRKGERGGLWLTPAGRAALGEPSGTDQATTATPDALRAVLAVLPCEEYRAMVRLVVATAVARHYLRDVVPDGWPGAVVAGQTNVGKTQVAFRAVCVVLGLDEATHTALLAGRSKGQILGRSVQLPGPGDRREFVPAVALGRPLVAYDEAHEADGEPVQALRDLLHGATSVQGERGALVPVAPTVMVLGNLDPGEAFVGRYAGARVLPLPRNLARRCYLLDTRPLDSILPAVPDAARALKRLGQTMRPLSLSRCRPAAADLPDAACDALRSIETLLTPVGRALFDVRALELTALGMSALLPATWDADLRCRVAAAIVALDYLTTRSTLGGLLGATWQEQAAPVREWLAAAAEGGDLPTDVIPSPRLTPEVDDEAAAQDRRAREEYATRRDVTLARIDAKLADLPKTAPSRWTPQMREELTRIRTLLKTRRQTIERADGKGGLRAGYDQTAVRAALARLDPLDREADEAIDAATAFLRDAAITVPPPPPGKLGSGTPTTPRAATRARKPRKGEPPRLGDNWVPSDREMRMPGLRN